MQSGRNFIVAAIKTSNLSQETCSLHAERRKTLKRRVSVSKKIEKSLSVSPVYLLVFFNKGQASYHHHARASASVPL